MKHFTAFLTAIALVIGTAAKAGPVKESFLQYFNEPGKNLLVNGGFENALAGWEATGSATLTLDTTTEMEGKASAVFNSSAASEYMQLKTGITPQSSYDNKNCTAIFYYTYSGSSGDYVFELYDGSNVVTSVDLEPAASSTQAQLTYPCATSGAWVPRIASTVDGGDLKVDLWFFGENKLFDISQATFVGSIEWVPTTDCQWARNNAAYGVFNADTDCDDNTITYKGNAIAESSNPGQYPRIRLSTVPAGHIVIEYEGSFGVLKNSSTDAFGAFRVTDGSSESVPFHIGQQDGSANLRTRFPKLSGSFDYDNPQNDVTFDLESKYITSAAQTEITASEGGLKISVYSFPSESQQAVKPDMAVKWGAAQWSNVGENATTSGTFADVNITGASAGAVLHGGAGAASVTDNIATVMSNVPAGTYKVSLNGRMYADGASTTCSFRLYDNTNSIPLGYARAAVGASDTFEFINELKDVVKYTSLQPTLDIRAQYRRDAGGGNCRFRNDTADDKAVIIFQPISENITAPLLVNTVVNPREGVTKIVSAYIEHGGTPTVGRQDGTWIDSLDDNGTGDTTINVTNGTFSGTQNCTCTVYSGSFARICQIDTATALSTSAIRVHTSSDNGTATDNSFFIMCMGPN